MCSFINLLHKKFHSLILLLTQNQNSGGRLNLYVICTLEEYALTLSTDYRKSYFLSLPFVLVSENCCPKVTSWELWLSTSLSCVAEAKWKLLISNVCMKKKVESLSVHVLKLCANSSQWHVASSCGIMQFFGHLCERCFLGFLLGLGLLQVLLVSVVTSAFSLFHHAYCTVQCLSKSCDGLPLCHLFMFCKNRVICCSPHSQCLTTEPFCSFVYSKSELVFTNVFPFLQVKRIVSVCSWAG